MYTIYHYFVLSSIAIVVLCNAYNTGIRHGTPQSRDSLPDKRLVALSLCVSLAVSLSGSTDGAMSIMAFYFWLPFFLNPLLSLPYPPP